MDGLANHKYNKTTDEIVAACSKHREAALKLKEQCEKQKKKIDSYKQQNEQLRLEVKEFEEESDEFKRKNNHLEKEVKELENKLKLKVREYNQNEDEYQVENKFLNERLEKMCRMNENKLKEIGQFCWDLEEQKKVVIEKNGEIELLERKKAVADRVIKNLQIEKDDLKEEVKAVCLENELIQAELKTLKSDEINDVKDLLANQEDNIQNC